MTIDKAIEIKGRTGEEFLNTDPDEIDEAERLSIEALKRLQEFRLRLYPDTIQLLPGETPETDPNRSLHHIKEVLESPLGREPR